jgi:hypothetical protein
VNLLGLRFTKINLLGNEAEVTDPRWVFILAWIIWAWAYAQYVVWYIDIAAWASFRQAVFAQCRKMLGRKAEQEPIPQWLREQLYGGLARQTGQFSQSLETTKYVRKLFNVPGEEDYAVRVINVVVTAYAQLPDQRGHVQSETVRFEREITPDEWQRNFRISLITILLTRRFVLEYFAPFAIGLLPVIIQFPVLYKHVAAAFGVLTKP